MLGLCLSYVCLHALPGSQALHICAFSSSIWNSNNGLRFNKLSLAHCPTFVCGVRTLPLSSDFKSCTVALLASFVQTDSIVMCFPQLADAYIDKRRLPLQGTPTVHRKTTKISYTGTLDNRVASFEHRLCLFTQVFSRAPKNTLQILRLDRRCSFIDLFSLRSPSVSQKNWTRMNFDPTCPFHFFSRNSNYSADYL